MKNSGKIRILIADDHAVVRMGLAALLRKEADMTVVGESEDGMETVRLAHQVKPDLIIMDFMMPKMDGAAATEAILKRTPDVKILILTTFGTSDGISRALQCGASGAVQKNISSKVLLSTIRRVAYGERVISDDILDTIRKDPIPQLTQRQLEVLTGVTRGMTNNDIAQQLGITSDGVKAHLTTIFAKLGVSGRSEAISLALRRNILKP